MKTLNAHGLWMQGLVLLFALTQTSKGQSPPWAGISYNGRTVIVRPGIAVSTYGTISNTTEVPTTERWMVEMLNIHDKLPVSGRTDVTATTQFFHHPSWHVDEIGNVYGVAINTSTADVFVTASSNYGAGFWGETAILKYGAMSGGGADSIVSAGRVYKIDAVTGAASVFAVLPQVSTTITHSDCEYGDTKTRTTGVGLGNIAYDAKHNQFFVSNMEDGRIYRLSAAGVILDSYDPGVYDDGTAGIRRSGVTHFYAMEDLPYGLAVDPDGGRLYYGGIDATTGSSGGNPGIYSIDLLSGGGFSGVVNNTWRPSGATYSNYVEGAGDTEFLHTTISAQGNSTFSSNIVYQVADLTITPNGDMLVGIRVGCDSSFYTSYSHQGETNLIKRGAGGKYDGGITELDISVTGDGGNEDSYGGVAYYEHSDGSGKLHYVVSTADILAEAGPHGIAVFDSEDLAGLIDPLAAMSYEIDTDPAGVGGDVEVFSLPMLKVGNLVFFDNDADGKYGIGDVPAAGVDVYLFNQGVSPSNLGLAVMSDTTDANGNYLLKTATAGNYFVHIPPSEFGSGAPLVGCLSTPGAGGDTGTDDDGDENGINAGPPASNGVSSGIIALAFGTEPLNAAETGQNGSSDFPDADGDMTVDFGFGRPTIGDFVWNDLNEDGDQDTGEIGIPGVTVSLHTSGGAAVACDQFTAGHSDDFDPAGGLSGSDVSGSTWDTNPWVATMGSGSTATVATDVDGYALRLSKSGNVSRVINISACDSGTAKVAFQYRLSATEVADTYALEYQTSGGWQTGTPLWTMTGGTNSVEFLSVNVSLPDNAIAIRFVANGSLPDDLVFFDNVSISCQMIAPVRSVTDANGRYRFDAGLCLVGGTAYKVRVDLNQDALDGFAASPANQGGNDAKDSDGIVSGSTSEIAVTASTTAPNASNDFGFYDTEICVITAVAGNVVRDSKGTPDGDDDTFTFDVIVSEDFGSTGWTSDDTPESGSYDVATAFGPYDVTDGAVTIIFADLLETSCADTLVVNPPPPPCVITATVVDMQVQDQSTPLTTDDTFTFDVNITAVNASSGWTSNQTPASGSYGTTVTYGPYPITTTLVTLIIIDSVDSGCSRQLDVGGPEYSEMSLGNLVFEDLDNDGVFDFNFDLGAHGVTVQLFLPGPNGQPGGNDDVFVASATTGSSYPNEGCFLFEHLSPGTYFMMIPASQFGQGGPLHGMISIAGNDGDLGVDDDGGENGIDVEDPAVTGVWTDVITLSPGMEPNNAGTETGECASKDADDYNGDMTVDFGFRQPPVGIGNLVFIDVNGDGDYDSGTDTAVEGVTVLLYAEGDVPGTSSPLDSTVTDVNGYYELINNDTYEESFFVHIPPAEFQEDDDGDGDSGELSGYVSVPGTGGLDEDDDEGENGVDVIDPSLTGISSGLIFLPQMGAPQDADETGQNGDGDVDDDNFDYTVDLGFVSAGTTVGVGNVVFFDTNRDGKKSSGESGAVNVSVELFKAAAPPNVGVAITSTHTDANGCYYFTGLVPGDYVVHLPGSNFSSGPLSGYVSALGAGGDTGTDDTSDENGIDTPNPVNGGISSGVISLAAAVEAVDAGSEHGFKKDADNAYDSNIDLTVDFGMVASVSLVGVGNLVFNDYDADGKFEPGAGETGIDGVKVELYMASAPPGSDSAIASTTTAGGGCYFFGGMTPGNYVIHLPASNFLSGEVLENFLSSPGVGGDVAVDDSFDENGFDDPNPGLNGISTSTIVLASLSEPTDPVGESGKDGNSDNLADSDINLTIDFGMVELVAIGNLVFEDIDGDGKYETGDGDAGIDGVKVEVFIDGENSPHRETRTVNGVYLFDRLMPGDYVICIPSSEFQIGESLEGMASSLGFEPDDAGDDDVSENGMDAPGLATAVKSPVITLKRASEPVGESGFGSYGGTLPDANVNLTVDFAFASDGDGDSIPDGQDPNPLAFDPHGYVYNEDTCEIITGGSIAVSGPGDVFVHYDGSTGAYQWFITRFNDPVNGGIFAMTYTPPAGYLLSNSRPVESPSTYAPPSGPTPVFRGAGDSQPDGDLDNCTFGANPYNFVFNIEPADAFVFNNNIPLRTVKAAKYADFAYDYSASLGLENDPDDNPDGDFYSNGLEYAIRQHPGAGANAESFHVGVNENTGEMEASFYRLRGGLTDVTYTLQSAITLGNPTVWTNETVAPDIDTGAGVPADAEKVSYKDLESEIAAAAFVRLKVEISGDTSGPHFTEVSGWRSEVVPAALRTYSFPFAQSHVFSGIFISADVSGAGNNVIDVSGVMAELSGGTEYYLEILNGQYEGHRLEVDEAATDALSLVLETGSARNTLDPIPATLYGAFAIRPHSTIEFVLPVAEFSPHNNSALGDQALLFVDGTWQVLWVYDSSGGISSQWTDAGNSSLDDVGKTVIAPCDGFFINPRAASVNLTSVGIVRHWKFACPLPQDYSLVGSAYPFDQSPADRGMLRDSSDGVSQNYFSANASPVYADQILAWLGDEVTGMQGYRTYYDLYVASTSYDYWTDQTNSNLSNENASPLFKNQRAVFIEMENGHDRSAPSQVWVWPAGWHP